MKLSPTGQSIDILLSRFEELTFVDWHHNPIIATGKNVLRNAIKHLTVVPTGHREWPTSIPE